ncbi:MAG: histidine phosphatase family protein [Actinobacteria bacterium 13_2_20CM_2_72_6]|nr:MAG: histidine phosphatase family protein [Actinobacteria bacterium 13_2_20CM_2_72_6]
MAVQLVYETHSITVDNERGVATGWLPGQLSARGRELAAELGRRRRSDGISAVFVSDLTRALETAAIAFEGSGIPVYIDSRLRECDFGEWNGTPIAVLEPQRRNHLDVPWPGGESYRQAVGRTGAFLADLARDWDGRRVLVIAHAAQRRALQHIVDGIPLEDLVEAPFDWREGWEYRL